MIKKVKTEELKPGVFIHDFNCDWQGENIFIEQTLVKDARIVEILSSWGIQEVYIDTERGIDIESGKTLRQVEKETDEGIHELNTSRKREYCRPEVPLAKEAERAIEIRDEAIEVVKSTVQLVMDGKPPEVGQTYELVDKMKESIGRNRDALLLLTRIRRKDQYTLYHSVSVSALVLDMCDYLGLAKQCALDMAVGALFHDIGKTRVPDAVLNKPGKLTSEEYHLMKKHVEYSVELLRDAKGLPFECYDIALHHHERFDGMGYPHGLRGEQISQGAQVTSLCDVFDAITSERCYKEGIDTVTGLRKLYEWSGLHFSRKLAYDFIRCIGVYPVGSWVRTRDGWVGVVIEATESMLQPVIKVMYDARKKKKVRPFKLDLAKTGGTIKSYGEPRRIDLKPSELLAELIS